MDIMKVALEGVSYDDFVVPECPSCLSEGRHNSVVCNFILLLVLSTHYDKQHKPEVIFFGESIPKVIKERSSVHLSAMIS